MSVKIFDTMTTATPNFPLAYAEKINIVKEDGSEADIQTLYNSGDLGSKTTAITISQEEFDALDEQTKLENDYRCYDTGRLYYKGVRYGHDEPETIKGFSKFKEMKEQGLIDDEEEYLVEADENGILLEASDIGYSNAVSNLPCTTVQGAIDNNSGRIATLETSVATKQENIFKKHILNVRAGEANRYVLLASCKVASLSLHNEPIVLSGVMGENNNANKPLFEVSVSFKTYTTGDTIFTGYINKNIFNTTDMFVTVDESTSMVYLYLDMYRVWSLASFDITIPQRNIEYYGLTIADVEEDKQSDTFIGTEIARMSTSTGVKVLAGLDDQTTSETSTWSSSKIASEIGAKITSTKYRGSRSIDITTGGKLTLIYSSEYASQAGCYMLLSNFNTEPLLIELGRTGIGQFKVTATHKSENVDTITVTAAGDDYSWYVLQF